MPPDRRRPDDARFVRDLLDDAVQRVCIDTTRVYAAGFSGGARLASEIACTMPERIAALGGLRAPSGCRGRRVAVIAFYGTADPVNPYPGGGCGYWGSSIAALDRWAARHGSSAVAGETHRNGGVDRCVYRNADGTDELVFYRIDGGGHTWPGSVFPVHAARFGLGGDQLRRYQVVHGEAVFPR